ncbi:MAG: Asp-tRNA(Asn)/Glu-tRNA(Gln) amidotransferase GatCAB subunit A [Rhodospirillaceae bacterium]|nr:Asp-tRNA(Asn)/Glu-tRNA(Gln) amidotransferase GatCAB subunit A [Rhodospirillaceae bacterium]|tara:strand:- start:713 stop:2188 length:1476 start_codon:yes stop_codon:yes gene_type:complete
MVDILNLNLSEARRAVHSRELSAVELTEAYLEAIASNKSLNSFITVTDDKARQMAKAADERISRGSPLPMDGMPIGVKDLFCTQDTLTTAGSNILNSFVPNYESRVTANLWRDGAVMLGKTNMDEFAMGSANTTSHYGPVENPWRKKEDKNVKLVPGGSSGGSASATAARLALASTGTDTGGSIRQPASFCGIVGLKPTYGRCSRWGIVAFASSLDQAGPLTRTVRDSAIVLKSISGHDARDSTSANIKVPDFETALNGDVRGMRVGIPRQYRMEGMPDEIEHLWKNGINILKDAGATIVDIDLPHTKYALPTYYIIAPAEASSNLARYDGVRYGLRTADKTLEQMYEKTRSSGFGAEVKRRILIGTYVLSAGYYDAYYLKAQRVRALIKADFEDSFRSIDVLLTPTAPSDAFAIGANDDDPLKMYLNDIFTVPASLAGLPAVSVPAGLSKNSLPLGLQIIGKMFDEESILKVADVIETGAGFAAYPWREA